MIAVIGDVHGCYFTLVELYLKIEAKYSGIKIYCVGDLVDRGNNTKEVIDFITEKEIEFTPGNHDYMFYHYFKKPDTIFAKSWLYNGNEATLNSYENNPDKMEEHIKIIQNAPLIIDTDDCFISHAGISIAYKNKVNLNSPNMITELKELVYDDYEKDYGVMWTRGELLNLGKAQVLGHTKTQEIIVESKANAYYIDTGACSGNKLTAAIFERSKLVEVIEEPTHLNDIV
jgi:serine/threonine protein phosphatase 1